MQKYTLAQIMEAWTAAYGEDMQEEYSGFFKKLQAPSAKQELTSSKQSAINRIIKDN